MREIEIRKEEVSKYRKRKIDGGEREKYKFTQRGKEKTERDEV
jgi:hypothetical protein